MLEPATEEFREKVCESIKTNPKQLKRDVESLKEWIKRQPHLPQSSSDELLTAFLIASKNSLERSKERIDSYYTARLEIPDFFYDRDPENERARVTAEGVKIFMLPKTTPEGYRVNMAIITREAAQSFDVAGICRRTFDSLDVRFNLMPFCLGDYFIMDSKLFTASNLLKVTPTLARDLIRCLQGTMPINVKGLIFFNSPSYMELAINILKPFMKKKLIQRTHIYTGGPEVIEKYFPRKMLPRDYGGEEDSSEKLHEEWCGILRENRNWLMAQGSETVDESKRMRSPDTGKACEVYGVQGSFKKLCID